jgi:hypothetical protein
VPSCFGLQPISPSRGSFCGTTKGCKHNQTVIVLL